MSISDKLNLLLNTKSQIKKVLQIEDNVFSHYTNIVKKYVDNQLTSHSENGVCASAFDVPIKDMKIYGNMYNGVLPSIYQEVEYIESTGTQYIDTGISGASSYNFEIVAKPSTENPTALSFLIGSDDAAKAGGIGIYISSSSPYKLSYRHGTSYGNYDNYTVSNLSDTFHKYKVDETNKLFLDDTRVDGNEYEFKASIGGYNVTLFARNNTGYLASKWAIKSAKIYQGTTLVRDFIPCVRRYDKAIGLYDLVTNTFYENAGTDTFNKGNDVVIANKYVGDLVTTGTYAGKYKVPVKFSLNSNTNTYDIYINSQLLKAGNGADYIDYKRKKKVKKVGHYVIDGTETWKYNATNQYFYSNKLFDNYVTGNINIVSNYYKGGSASAVGSDKVIQTGSSYTFMIADLRFTTSEEFKSYLAENNIDVWYAMSTAVEEDIDTPTITTQRGNVTVSTNTTIKGEIDVEYVVDIAGATTQMLNAEIDF